MTVFCIFVSFGDLPEADESLSCSIRHSSIVAYPMHDAELCPVCVIDVINFTTIIKLYLIGQI